MGKQKNITCAGPLRPNSSQNLSLKSTLNYKYRLRLQSCILETEIDYRADEVPQCQKLIAAYRTATGLTKRASHNDSV